MTMFDGYQLDDLSMSSRVERQLQSLLDSTTSRSMEKSSTKSWKRSDKSSRSGSDYRPMQLQDLIPDSRPITHKVFCLLATPLSTNQLDHLKELREQNVVIIPDVEDNQSDKDEVQENLAKGNSRPSSTDNSQISSLSLSHPDHQPEELRNATKTKNDTIIIDNHATVSTTRSIPTDQSLDEVGLNARTLDQATSDQIQEILLMVDDDPTLVELIERTTNREFILAAIRQISDPELLEQMIHVNSSEIFYNIRTRYRQLTGL